jgi:hypothetical protein
MSSRSPTPDEEVTIAAMEQYLELIKDNTGPKRKPYERYEDYKSLKKQLAELKNHYNHLKHNKKDRELVELVDSEVMKKVRFQIELMGIILKSSEMLSFLDENRFKRGGTKRKHRKSVHRKNSNKKSRKHRRT